MKKEIKKTGGFGSFILGLTAMMAGLGCSTANPTRNIASLSPHIQNAWIEMGPNGTALARAIVSDSPCPTIQVDSRETVMQERAAPSADGHFPGLVCEQAIGVKNQVQIGGQKMAVVLSHPKKILFIGDTGCRIKSSAGGKTKIQNCNDSKNGWPFAQLAQAAAKQKPDLVVHVGDYHYREAPCPAGNEKCEGSVYGDNWVSWNEDFFTPAGPLLTAAPWVFVRGNHEVCSRAQEGYFRFLDPRPPQGTCEDVVPPYLIPFKNFSLAVMDSSADDIKAPDLKTIETLQTKGAWLVTHRPPWVSAATKAKGDGDPGEEEAKTVQNNSPLVGVPANIGLVITGHLHLFRAVSFHDGRPPQIISGNGGTLLEDHPAVESQGTPVDGTVLDSAKTFSDFGFMVLTETGSSAWSMQVFDIHGNPTVACGLTATGNGSGIMSMSCN